MVEAARGAGMRIVGPNTDGIANIAAGAVCRSSLCSVSRCRQGPSPSSPRAGRQRVPPRPPAARGHRRAVLRQRGQRDRLGLADYLSVAVQDPEVRMVLSFVEAVRRPADFVAVARLASELGKPIVLIKVGRTAQAAARAAAHTGALAGEDRIYEALFRSLGVIPGERCSARSSRSPSTTSPTACRGLQASG